MLVVFDCDSEGREAAAKVAADLVGVADARVLDLDPQVDDGFDLSDFTSMAKSASERAEVKRTLERCFELAPRVDAPQSKSEPVAEADTGGPFALALDDFIAATSEAPAALAGDEDDVLLPAAGLLILAGRGGRGKTTLAIEAALYLASGIGWLGIPVPRPLRLLFLEAEGPREPFRRKLAAKRVSWPHEIQGAIFVQTFCWGCMSLADDESRQRLRRFIEQERIDLVIGDPLDMLGLEGVGSPENTRDFLELLKSTGLFRDLAWILLGHLRKERTLDELDELSGAWGGRPDTVLVLDALEGNRARLSFPKVRWGSGKRPALILGFDPATESFEVVAEEGDEERYYAAEITTLLADGRWRTAKEIAAPKDGGNAGIGANVGAVKGTLEGDPTRFVSRTGEAAKEVGRHPSAMVWQVTQAPESPESPPDSQGRTRVGDSVTQPYRSHQSPSQLPSEPEGDSDAEVTSITPAPLASDGEVSFGDAATVAPVEGEAPTTSSGSPAAPADAAEQVPDELDGLSLEDEFTDPGLYEKNIAPFGQLVPEDEEADQAAEPIPEDESRDAA